MKHKLALVDLLEDLKAPIADWPQITDASSIREAAEVAVAAGSPGVVVSAGDTVLGVVTVQTLLRAMLRDEDPITGLPRSGPLRDWLSARLRERREVSLLFFDIDRFGDLNRSQGHAAGDATLEAVASVLSGLCSEGEFCARFGGDEFAIATLRNRAESEDFARLAVEKLAKSGFSVSVGVSGGRRTAYREDSNVGATVEELIRLASLACIAQKEDRRREPF